MLKGLYILQEKNFDLVYGLRQRSVINHYVNIEDRCFSGRFITENPEILLDVDVIFGSWGMPVLCQRLLDYASDLKVIFYAAGSTRGFITDDFWERGILLTSAWVANAIPVAEFTVSQIVFGLKNGWHYVRGMRRNQGRVVLSPSPGGYQSTVGLLGFGMVARHTARLLKSYDLNLLVYDPFISCEEAADYGGRKVSMDEVFSLSDVVSVHIPEKLETRGVITNSHFLQMKPNSTFINTARGSIVKEEEMIEALTDREDITAVLDVTDPEPPRTGSLLYKLDNVVLSPHISGSFSYEKRRLGDYMIEELKRFIDGDRLEYLLNSEKVSMYA